MVSTNANCVTDTRKTSWKRNVKLTKSKQIKQTHTVNSKCELCVPLWQSSRPERVCKCDCACVSSLWSSVKTRIHVTFWVWNVNKSSPVTASNLFRRYLRRAIRKLRELWTWICWINWSAKCRKGRQFVWIIAEWVSNEMPLVLELWFVTTNLYV